MATERRVTMAAGQRLRGVTTLSLCKSCHLMPTRGSLTAALGEGVMTRVYYPRADCGTGWLCVFFEQQCVSIFRGRGRPPWRARMPRISRRTRVHTHTAAAEAAARSRRARTGDHKLIL